MRCPKCLSENTDTSKFCSNCGSSFGAEERPEAAGPVSVTKTLETPVHKIAKGTLIGEKYRILEEIGRGGMGIVYEAEDIKLKRAVALKFLPHQWTSDIAARERFIHEAQAASALDHPNICTIHEIEETEDDRMYIAMAFYEGESLREKIKREPLKTEEAIEIAIQVAQGMAKAHQKGIVHRDIKPANILITNDGLAKIVDFGLAKLAGQVKLTREGATVGTVAYMSPEQAQGEAVDQRTDIWSLGVVLYEMLSGKLPFKGDYEQSLIHSILRSEPEPITKFRKDLPAGLAQIIDKALSKSPAARYQTMDDLIEDLKAVAEGLKPLRAKTGLLRGRILGIKKVHAAAGLGIFLVLAALAILFLFLKRDNVYDSLAVLPFENRSRESGQDSLADGLTEEVISKFHAVGSLRVPPFNTVADYRKTKKSCREIGREQNVRAVLYASFQRVEDRIRIWVRLLDASTELALWNKDYTQDVTDILALESEIALDIVREIQLRLSPDEQKRLLSSQKVASRAWDAYQEAKSRANAFYNEPTFERWKSVFPFIQKAIDIDPQYAPFFWTLAGHWFWGQGFILISYKEAIEGAEAAINKGLALDRESPEMHIAVGQLDFLKWDWEGFKREAKRAVELAPGDPNTHNSYALALGCLGFADEAISEAKRAVQLDPSSDDFRKMLGTRYWFSGRHEYNESIAVFREALQRNPNHATIRNLLALSYALKGMPAEAIAEAEKSIASLSASEENMLHLNVALVYAIVSRREDAKKLLDECLDSRKGKPIDTYTIAEIYSALDEKDEAFKWLEKTFQDRHSTMFQFKTDPFMDNIRSDPRFKDYLKKAGFEN